MHRDAFGDDHDERHARVDGLDHGGLRPRWRDVDHGDVRAGLLDRLGHGREDRDTLDLAARLLGVGTADDR